MTATDEMRCAKCGRTVKRGIAYGYACPRGLACGPFEPIQDVRVHSAPSALCSLPTAKDGHAMTEDWRSIPAAAVDWELNPISKRGGGYVRMMCNHIYWHSDKYPTGCGGWKDMTLGDIADLGEKYWLRCTNIGPKVVLVIKWILDEAASGRCPFLAATGRKAADAYVPSVRPQPPKGDTP